MHPPSYWAVVPAAGVGSRMGSSLPKQYLTLGDKTVIELALSALLDHPLIRGVVVALSEDDDLFHTLAVFEHPKLRTVLGGAERADSVLAGLVALSAVAGEEDWILVHDAARPCLQKRDIDSLINTLGPNDAGAILAQPVVETVKLSDGNNRIAHTLSRDHVFLAQTPQCFKLRELREGYALALQEGWAVTDEASVFERLGVQPRLVAGRRQNIKVTHPDDLALARFFLQQESE